MTHVFLNKKDFFFVTDKTNVILKTLKEKYQDIRAYCVKFDPGNIRIGFSSWGKKEKLILLLGSENEKSYWINCVKFNTSVLNCGIIEFDTTEKQLEHLYIVIDNLIADSKNNSINDSKNESINDSKNESKNQLNEIN